MRLRFFQQVFIALLMPISLAYGNEIAFSFDDSPRKKGLLFHNEDRATEILRVLEKYKIQTVFFSNSEPTKSEEGKLRLIRFANAGHLIANHSHSHPSLNRISAADFIKDISLADQLLSPYPTFIKWFRFPYLHEGKTQEDRDLVRVWLKNNHYLNGYVTVDNFDYFIDDLVQESLTAKKKVHLSRACKMLIDVMWDGIQFYDTLAKKHLGTVKHILLQHETDLEAYCLEELIQFLQAKNWKIISPLEAYTDPILSQEPKTLYLNQGRIAALVHDKTGVKHISSWEDETALNNEFQKRKIAE